jgi:VWFA-related protein
MKPKRLAAAVALILLAVGFSVAQGPKKTVGRNVPLPPISEEEDKTPPRELGEDDQFALSIDVDLVQFDVVVTDGRGNPVSGLVKEHFTITEDKVEQTITNFSPTDAPMTVVLLIEFGDTFGYYYDDVVRPAAGFINSLREDDWAAVVAYDIRPEILADFTQNRDELFGGLRRLRYPAYRETSLYDAVAFTLERMENIDGKKAIFLLSTGFDTISKHNYGEVLKMAEGSDTMIYSVGMAQLFRTMYEDRMGGLARISFLQAENVLRSLANASGGTYFFPRFQGEYRGIYETVSANMRNQYSLAFVPTNQEKDGKLHKIKVEVPRLDVNGDGKPDKLKVRHKKGYYARTN